MEIRVSDFPFQLPILQLFRHRQQQHLCSVQIILSSHLEKMEGRIEVTRRRSRRRKQLLDDHKETRGYLKLKEEALNLSL
jgi:hypothetical protein